MSTTVHPAAPHYLPGFITAPGETDVLMVGSAIFIVVAVLGLGSIYFRLHSLPEKLAHGNASKVQFEVVAVLALLALFTHNTIFWFGALLLALVPIPDMHGPLARMADALTRMANRRRGEPAQEGAGAAPARAPEQDYIDTLPLPEGFAEQEQRPGGARAGDPAGDPANDPAPTRAVHA